MIRVIAVGKLRKGYNRDGVNDYARRIARFAHFEIVEVADSCPATEAKPLLAKAKGWPLIACDRSGDDWSTEELARLLGEHGSPCFFIGGPEGLDPTILERSDHRLRFGRITLPHELARLVLVEQIYRGLSLLRGHPYHR